LSLGEALSAPTRPSDERVKAAWLLKDLCNSLSVPHLEEALQSPTAPSELRLQILDTLERFAFGRCIPSLNVDGISRVLSTPSEVDRFVSLLATLGDDASIEVLRRYARDPEVRPRVLSVLDQVPGPGVDSFLTGLADESGDTSILRTLENRRTRSLQMRLREPGNLEAVGVMTVQHLLERRDLSLVVQLAEQQRLDEAAADIVRAAVPHDGMTKAQRKMLRRAQALLNK
jgi:hypothetical protein